MKQCCIVSGHQDLTQLFLWWLFKLTNFKKAQNVKRRSIKQILHLFDLTFVVTAFSLSHYIWQIERPDNATPQLYCSARCSHWHTVHYWRHLADFLTAHLSFAASTVIMFFCSIYSNDVFAVLLNDLMLGFWSQLASSSELYSFIFPSICRVMSICGDNFSHSHG